MRAQRLVVQQELAQPVAEEAQAAALRQAQAAKLRPAVSNLPLRHCKASHPVSAAYVMMLEGEKQQAFARLRL
jgi:hypothetical protein